jgi:hypothetical protein
VVVCGLVWVVVGEVCVVDGEGCVVCANAKWRVKTDNPAKKILFMLVNCFVGFKKNKKSDNGNEKSFRKRKISKRAFICGCAATFWGINFPYIIRLLYKKLPQVSGVFKILDSTFMLFCGIKEFESS